MATATAAPEVPTIDDAAVEPLRSNLRGALLRPDEPGYDTARTVWNASIDRRPALIARCAGAADVVAAVDFAREHGLLLSVKGGGHNVAGKAVCDGGLMLDLSPMKSVRVDPAALTARAEPGVLWGEFDRETQSFGLATVGGVVATTGVAGLTLGGGQGWLTGKHGLSLDNLRSVDVVLADGRLVTASDAQAADLFWAMRGAGANFGVATSFEYQLHPIGSVLGGLVIHSIDRAGEMLRFYREFAPSQPDELTTYAAILTAPDDNVVAAMVTCFAGPFAEGERAVAPLRRFGPPIVDTIAPLAYTDMQGLLGAAFPHGRRNYWKSGLTDEITDAAIAAVVEFGRRVPSPHTAIVVADCHGAYRRVEQSATAYHHRDQQFDLVILSSWTDSAATEANVGWTRNLFAAVEPELSGGVYVNDLGEEGSERVRDAYGTNYGRLVALKRTYDPANLFRMNQNIAPAGR